MPSSIVTTHYRYKRPPRKKKPIVLTGSAIVRIGRKHEDVSKPAYHAPANDDRKSAIVAVKRRGRFGDAPDMTPEEHRRRGNAADALFREMVRLAAGKP